MSGEPGPWPLVSSSFGQFDYAGFAKSASYWYRALWLAHTDAEADYGRPPLPAEHVVRISQSWQAIPPGPPPPLLPEGCDVKAFLKLCPNSNRGQCLACARAHSSDSTIQHCEGVAVWPTICSGGFDPEGGKGADGPQVQVFSDLPLIELFLNGETQGTAPCTPGGFAAFTLKKWAPGNLTAIGMTSVGGAAKASHTILTASEPVAIVLSVDVPSLATGTGSSLVLDGHDSGLIRATLVDKLGRIADADNMITFKIESGPGRISGVHNGDAKSHEPQASDSRSAYHGLCRAAVKVTRDTMSDTLLSSEVEIATGDGVETVALGSWSDDDDDDAMEIVVSASAPGLKPGKIAIPVSTDESDAPLAVAGADLEAGLVFE